MLDKSEQRLVDDIARVGWHLIGVERNVEGPSFTYSIGLTVTFNHPEIIMFGLDVSLMADVINNMGRDIRKGRRFDHTSLFTGLIERYACKTAPVSDRFHPTYFGYAMWHRRHIEKAGTLAAIQCLWPEKAGLFPDETGCHPEVLKRQPLLQ